MSIEQDVGLDFATDVVWIAPSPSHLQPLDNARETHGRRQPIPPRLPEALTNDIRANGTTISHPLRPTNPREFNNKPFISFFQ
jgi:hypothetical protein